MIGLNPKQKKLIDGLPQTTNYTMEATIYSIVKHKMLKDIDNVDGSIRNETCKSNLNLRSVTDIDLNKDKVTAKFCKDLFEFVPKQITSYARFMKEIGPYQTRSIMIHFNFEQDSNIDKDTCLFEVKMGPQKNKEFNETPGGVIWLTFYDNDTKLLIYEFYPSVYSRRRQTDIDQPMEIIRYQSKVNRVTKSDSSILPYHIPLDGLNNCDIKTKNRYLDIENIDEYRYKSINNLQESIVGYFKEDLV